MSTLLGSGDSSARAPHGTRARLQPEEWSVARLRAGLLQARRAWFAVVLLGAGLTLRAFQARGALLYPDGYQYLLMARGIGEHLRPVIQLGRGGELFVPNPDAAIKPLFPALIALVHLGGAGWRGAARALSVAAGGASVALCGLVAARLSASRLLGLGAALLLLFAPLSRYWAAFSSPDELGQALMLASILALLGARPRLAGMLAGLALFARPELGVLLFAGEAALAFKPAHRHAALYFLAAAFGTAAAVLAVLRPPLELSPTQVAVASAGALGAAALALLAPPRVGVAAGLAGLVLAAGDGAALAQLARHELPLTLAFVVGLVVARERRAAAVVSIAACALAFAYDARNGASTRYMVQLLPLAAIGAAIGAGRVLAVPSRLRWITLAPAVAAVALLTTEAAPAAPGPDMFGTIAAALPATSQPLITAAPDAYGFLLYPRPVRGLQTGSHGLLLLDAVARAYEPSITARGRVLARIAPGSGFLDPDGQLDLAPALLIAGTARSTPIGRRAAQLRPSGPAPGGVG